MNLTIPYDKTPEVMLLGNGINRAYNFMSWGELLSSISTEENAYARLYNVPAPLQAVILTNDEVDTSLKKISQKLIDAKTSAEEENVLRSIAKLPFDAVLTTNYTYEFEKALCTDFKVTFGKASKYRKNTSGESIKQPCKNMYTYFDIPSFEKPIWHVHGEAAIVNSMILGHYYYGKILSGMNSYLESLMKRYTLSKSNKSSFECRSWIDYFLIGNITIMALGLDFSEIDLWWLINVKKRKFPDTKITFYKPDITPEQEMLAKAYGVKVIKHDINCWYKSYYDELISNFTLN
jgi:hypothetical protein